MPANPSSQSTPAARWSDVLRAYAAVLDELRAALLLAGPEGFPTGVLPLPNAFDIPHDMPPCPPELAARLRVLQNETAGLIELAQDLLRRFPPVAPSRRLAAPAARSGTSLMDTRL